MPLQVLALRVLALLVAVWLVVGVVYKPAIFWENHKARTLRGLIGDSGAGAFYLILAVAIAVGAVLAP
ncbi:MAG: hypothetical protein GX442_22245 [Candidatus Riflebacteria bacterium]|nr:hypothetical protein [Candidatus Riflebacteria bacterium]